MYQQFGYDSAEDFARSYLGNFVHFDYDTASDMFRRYVQQLHADPSLGFSYFGLEDTDMLYRYIDYGQWKDMDDYCQQAAEQSSTHKERNTARRLPVRAACSAAERSGRQIPGRPAGEGQQPYHGSLPRDCRGARR